MTCSTLSVKSVSSETDFTDKVTFTRHFSHYISYFATLDNKPMTAERIAESEFIKYVNNMKVLVKSSLLEQAEALMHFSYEASYEKFLLVDLEGADYKSYDPNIATVETLTEAPSVEEFFYIGNLRETAINNFFTAHKYSVFCLELKMAEIELGESEADDE